MTDDLGRERRRTFQGHELPRASSSTKRRVQRGVVPSILVIRPSYSLLGLQVRGAAPPSSNASSSVFVCLHVDVRGFWKQKAKHADVLASQYQTGATDQMMGMIRDISCESQKTRWARILDPARGLWNISNISPDSQTAA